MELNVRNVDLQAGKLSILSKGQRDREIRSLPSETVVSLNLWIAVRGNEPGPLFTSLDRAKKGDGRLTGSALWEICKRLGLGRVAGLRHSSITAALEATGGNIRDVQKHARHRDIRTTCIYDDRREDIGGKLANMIAGNRTRKAIQ